jgi:LacI family transcriptional regulator
VPATLADVARRAGVSVATASRVVSGSAYGVSPELRERVMTAAQELNYVPNAHARALVGASTATVGVIVHDVSDPYFAEITRGIQRAASAADRLVMICHTYRDRERELAYVRNLHAQRVEAIIMAGSGLDDRVYSQRLAAQLDAFVGAGGKVTFVSRHHIPGDAVLPDNVGGAREMTRALIGLGHRNIGVITGPSLLTTTRDRFEGVRSAMREAGLALPPQNVVEGDFTRDGGYRAALALLDQAPGLTAIFALSDQMAVGALAALRERGIAVPGEVSVAGFDDISIARDVTPALSTVKVPMEQMGLRAMELALEPRSTELRVEYLPTEVLLRGSTAPPPA